MPPRQVIDVMEARKNRSRRHTFLLYGHTRAGKTRYAGTFPRPVFISEYSEHGYETLVSMNSEAFYEPNRAPQVYPISSSGELWDRWGEIKAAVAKDPDKYWTLVIDSLKFYADGFRAATEQAQLVSQSRTRGVDRRQVYGDLEMHLRYLMLTVHNEWPGNVVWTALAKDPDPEKGTVGGALIGGATDKSAPARCDFFWYLQKNPGTGLHEIHTNGFGPYPGGGRDEGKVPSPLTMAHPLLGATYRDFEGALFGSHRVTR